MKARLSDPETSRKAAAAVSPRSGSQRERLSVIQRFVPKFVVDDETGCWLWTASRAGRHGAYGKFTVDGQTCLAHRVSYELFVGQIPDGLALDHLCCVQHCVNPAHLEPVTARENMRRLWDGRDLCANGLHPRTPENISVCQTTGKRRCRPCAIAKVARWRLRQQEAMAA